MLSGFTEGSRALISAKKPSDNSKSTFLDYLILALRPVLRLEEETVESLEVVRG